MTSTYTSTYGTMYYVDDMEEAVSYYKRNLGLSPAFTSEDWTEFPVGEHHRICLHIKRHEETYSENGVLILNARAIKALFEKMRREGLNVYGLHEIHENAWSFNLKDLSGNELSFYGEP